MPPTVLDSSTFEGILATDDNMPFILLALQAADEIAVDTETSGLNVRNNVDYCMGICLAVDGMACYIPFRHKSDNVSRLWLDKLIETIKHKDLYWHNRKFDMHSLKTLGVDPLQFTGKQYCSMILASLVDEELFSKELDYLAKRFLKSEKFEYDVIKKLGDIYGYANIEPSAYRNYGSWDTVLTLNLGRVLWRSIITQNLESVYWETEEPFTRVLYVMEQRGVGVNSELAREYAERGRGRMATLYRELGGVNPASPKDLKKLLLDELGLPVLKHTKACEKCNDGWPVDSHEGSPSFDKDAMKDYDEILEASDNPTAKLISEYRGWQKATTSLYEPLLEKVGPDGRIRTEFQQHRTVTGRLSASDPNLQQIPRESTKPWNGNAKSCFNSGKPGYTLIGWDYSQVELRLAAAYGGESILLAEFERAGADPFAVLAPLIYGYLSKETRQDTKTFVYANLYGAGLRKIAAQLGRPVSEVKDLYDNYIRSIPGIMSVSRQVGEAIKQRGYITYWDGRRRHLKDKSKSYKIWNSVCQGGAAQMVKRAMIRLMNEVDCDDCQMVLQVHDEITFIIRTDLIEHYRPKIESIMVDFPQFGVTFAVDSKEWGEAA